MGRVHRAWLIVSAGLVALWAAQLATQAVSSYETLGGVGGALVGALAAASLSLAATPVAIRRLRGFAEGFDLSRGALFSTRPAYYRLVVFVVFGACLASIFGSTKEAYPRFACHLLGVMALHRLALCGPTLVQRAIEWIESNPVARGLDLVLANALAIVILAELGLRSLLFVQGPLPWLPDQSDPLANKLRDPIFGFAPNRLGYNDREFATEKTSGSLRIAAIGDSFFVAHVPRPYGVIAATERLLNERGPRRAELFNFGIVATNPTEYLEVLRRDALRFRPDAVLVGIYVGNDIKLRRPLPSPFGKRWYALYQTLDRWRKAQKTQRAIAETEFVDLTEIANESREFWFSDQVPAVHSRDRYLKLAARHVDHCREPTTAYREREWQTTLDALSQMKQICDEAGIPMLIVIQPDHVQISESLRVEAGGEAQIDLRYPQDRIRSYAEQRGIPALDLLPSFEAAEDPDALYLPNDNHWSALGNQLAAQALTEWLARVLGRDAGIVSRLGAAG